MPTTTTISFAASNMTDVSGADLSTLPTPTNLPQFSQSKRSNYYGLRIRAISIASAKRVHNS